MTERELFEQRFPVPAGIYWNDISAQYDALPGAAGFDDVEIYHGKWQAWQAARAQAVPNEHGKNRYGLDMAYFRELFNRELNRPLVDFRPDELARVLARAARTADAAVLQEPEFQAARAQSGQGVEPVARVKNRPWPKGVVPAPKSGRWYSVSFLSDEDGDLPDGTLLYTQPQPAQQGSVTDYWLEALARRAEDSDITYEATYDPGYDKPIEHDCDICERVADWIRAQKGKFTRPQPAQQGVPEGWRECLQEMVQAMHDYEMSVDEDAPYKHRAMMDRAHALLSATPQPEGKPDTVYWYFEGSEQDSLETLHKDVRVVISAGTLKGLLDGSPKQGSVPEDVIRQCEDAIQYASEIRGGCISGVREAQKRVRAILDTPQTAVPDGEERLTDIYRRQLFECQDALNNLRSEYHNRTAELETEIEDLHEELQRVRRQADVPEGWRECLAEMVQAMHDYEMSVDEDAPYKHRAMMDRAHALLSTTPQADGWVRCDERLPTEEDWWVWIYDSEDGDIFHALWRDLKGDYENGHMNLSHWMPTGLKRPQPPKEGA